MTGNTDIAPVQPIDVPTARCIAVSSFPKLASMPMKQFIGFMNGAIPLESLEQLIELSHTPVNA